MLLPLTIYDDFFFPFFPWGLGSVWMHASRWVWAKCVGTHRTCVQSTAVSAIGQQSRSAFAALLVEPIFPQEAKWLSCGLTLFVSAYGVCTCLCVRVCVRVCVWERERKKEKEREGYKVEQESLCMYIACSLFFVCQLVCLCTQAFLGDYMIAFQDWHAFLRSVWGLPVSWNIPLILRSRKCFMTVGTDVAPLRPVCKVWEERAGCYQNQNAPRQHSVAFVSWVRKSPSHQQCSMKVSQQQLVGFSHMGNHLNGLYTWGKKKTKKHVFLLTASGS